MAIDVESDVKFVSQRIDNPSRIFFDLRDTKLASTLVGKSFDVDDGFLKKVRVAQFAPGRTRVVLEVDSLSDYDAFLLPNPYRLIIDVHGKNGRVKQNKDAGDATLADANGVATPKATPDDDTDQDSSDAKPSVPAHAAGAGEDAKKSAPGTATASKKPTTVVKKIVEAGDDDDNTGALRAVAKRNGHDATKEASPARNAVAAKRPADGALDSDVGIREARPTASGDRP